MKKLIILLPLILILILITSCSPTSTPVETDEPEENIIVENGMDSEEDENLNQEENFLDLDRDFIPLEYEVEEAFPALEFEQPLLLTHAKDDSNRVYLVEKTGKVKVFNNDKNVETADVFLDLSTRIDLRGNEKGLLGLAFHPNYAENGYFYVNYTDLNSSIVARYSRKDGSDLGDFNSGEILLEFSQPYSNHNGGHLEFGPDGYLYIATGDGGSGGDPQNNAQNRQNLLGKILRINVDNMENGLPYAIPEDNPFKSNSQGYREEIFAYGLRNPWRFSFDTHRDILIVADVGQDKMEEINIVENSGNYGWNLMEGTLNYRSSNTSPEGLIPPIWEYDHSLGKSITGGYVYYGEANPSLSGVYIYGDFITGRIWGLWMDRDNNVENHELLDTDLMISSFGLDQNGEVYIVDYNGRILELKTK